MGQIVPLTKSEQFFYDRAGYGRRVDEDDHLAKVRNARLLAHAEMWALVGTYRFTWAEDWSIGSHVKEYGEAYDNEPASCEVCLMWNESGECVASLGCIDDADNAYRRIVEAELAADLMPDEVIAAIP